MRFFSPSLFIGAALSLEGMRRTLLGGTFLSLFLMKDFGFSTYARETLEMLKSYLDIESGMIDAIKAPVSYLITPWRDHNAAGRTFCQILEILIEQEFPNTCQFYWQKQES